MRRGGLGQLSITGIPGHGNGFRLTDLTEKVVARGRAV